MKALLSLLACLGIAASSLAQGTEYTPEQLDQMLGPIALYPDPLVALILPASTFPSEIAQAAQYVASGGDPSQVDGQPWDASVKGLAHYPDVLKWMNDNIAWTQALGAAFAMQSADVMKSVQQLRAEALAAGTLVSTPQMQVDDEGDNIRIIPGQDGTIYVPQYDPDDVYDVPEGYEGPFITYGVGYPAGAWLGFECDWDDFGVWVGPWHRGWQYRKDWFGQPAPGSGRWHADPARGRELARDYYHPGGEAPHPRPIAGAPGPGAAGRGAGPSSRGSVTIEHSQPDYRGYERTSPAPASPAPSGALFGGNERGSQVRDNSARGHASMISPVRRSGPDRSAAPSRREPH